MTPKSKQVKVKAWAIITEKGLITRRAPILPIYSFENAAMNYCLKGMNVVPCTITFNLPEK